MRNWKGTMKRLNETIKINKLQVSKILRAKKRLQAYMKRKKIHGMVMFICMM